MQAGIDIIRCFSITAAVCTIMHAWYICMCALWCDVGAQPVFVYPQMVGGRLMSCMYGLFGQVVCAVSICCVVARQHIQLSLLGVDYCHMHSNDFISYISYILFICFVCIHSTYGLPQTAIVLHVYMAEVPVTSSCDRHVCGFWLIYGNWWPIYDIGHVFGRFWIGYGRSYWSVICNIIHTDTCP